MRGLEIVEVNYSNIVINKDFRIDSDFWTKEPKRNPNLNYRKIGELLKEAQYGISVSMNEEGIGYPIFRMNEIHNMLCDLDVDKHADISKEDFKKFKLNNKDVLFNRTNSYEWVGRTGIYYEVDNQDFVFASYLVRFIPNEDYIYPEYLTAYLNTKYGVWDIKRRSRQSINQTNVNPEEVKEIYIPLLSKIIQDRIKENFEQAHLCRIKSNRLYCDAENLLFDNLGVGDFKIQEEAINIKKYCESFATTGRLDAEYYQSEYESYQKIIYGYSNGYELLKTACCQKDSNFVPEDEIEYSYVELADIGESGDIKGCTIAIGCELPTRARRKVNTNDIIVSSIEGSLDSCALVTESYDNALCSTGFYVLSSSKINSQTLLVLFKSQLMQNLLKRGCSGTILTAINKTEFQNIPIPLIEERTQQKIKDKIKESFDLKKRSVELLEEAKLAVEIAIEFGEKNAIDYLNNKDNNE